MIIDFHTHAFPEKIASKTIEKLAEIAGGLTPNHGGSEKSLRQRVSELGADKAVMLSIATNPKQEFNVNSFAISLINDDVIIPFGSVHPESENIDFELKRLSDAGIKGIKLHPDYQNFYVDEERMFHIYEKIASYGFITVFHAGVDIGFPSPVHGTPERLRRALPYFNGAPVVAAHWGGFEMWDEVLEQLADTDVLIDTSFSAGRIKKENAEKIFTAFGADRILFGSDMPWGNTADEADFVKSICNNEEEKIKILEKNAEKLLRLP